MRVFAFALLAACQSAAPTAQNEALERSTHVGVLIGDHWQARADRLDVRVDRSVRLRAAGGVREVVLSGRTSRALDQAYSWVPDDRFGTTTLRSPTRFEADLDLGVELRSILSGAPLMVAMHTTAGLVQDYNAWIGLGAKLASSPLPADVHVLREIQPVFLRGGPDTLRFRATLTAPAGSALAVSAAPGAEPAVSGDGAGTWTLDWSYAALEAAMAGRSRVDLGGVSFEIQPRLEVSGLGLTSQDPYNLWDDSCAPAVLSCLQTTTGADVAACGSWREVSRCAVQDPCAYAPPADLQLTAFAPGLEAAAEAWNLAAVSGGVWGSVEAPTAWEHPACLAEPAALAEIVAQVTQNDQSFAGWDFAWGQVLDREGLSQTPAFSSSYSPEGPALLAAIESLAGGGEVTAWLGESEIPCPNCHEWQDLYVLYYPASGQVIVLSATHGWDS